MTMLLANLKVLMKFKILKRKGVLRTYLEVQKPNIFLGRCKIVDFIFRLQNQFMFSLMRITKKQSIWKQVNGKQIDGPSRQPPIKC